MIKMNFKNKAIFWDRDGIINQITVKNGKSLSPRKFSKFKVYPFIHDLLSEIEKMGYINLIFTNQPDISRGLMEPEELNLMHNFLLNNYPISKIYSCPHSNEDNCLCRKPLPGMIFSGIKDFSLDTQKCYVVGDRITDIIAGSLGGIDNLYLLKKSYSLGCYDYVKLPKYHDISDVRELITILGK